MFWSEFVNTLLTSQSPQTGQFNSYCYKVGTLSYAQHFGLNPLKRVNSILTKKITRQIKKDSYVSIPSNGSIQFLLS